MRIYLMRAVSWLATAVLLLGGLLALPTASFGQNLPPDPQALPPTGDCVIDNIFYGETPPGGNTAPVLVFVHGLAGLAIDWWSDETYAGVNEMYARAYQAGYRTAFVNLNVDDNTPADCSVERRPANDNYTNGAVLAQQLQAITEHYAVNKVDIIAHSKGGIDSQTAIVWSGAWNKVRSLFTLGTPHQGSILVDQLWSPEGAWLAGLLGQLDGATYALQTPEMQQFRAATDPMTVDDAVDYYVAAGTLWDVQGLPIYRLTGNWLQNHPDGGDNDAVVTVDSTYLPGASTLFVRPWTHIDLYMGQNSFELIRPYLPVEIQAPTSVTVSGPVYGMTNRDYLFTATVGPGNVTQPLTYTWQATDLVPLQVVGASSDSRALRWQRPGLKAVRVTAANGSGAVTTTYYVFVWPSNSQFHQVMLPLALNRSVRVAPPPPLEASPEPAAPVAGVPFVPPTTTVALNQIARGGRLSGAAVERIPIEPQAVSASVTLLASSAALQASLQAPDGQVFPMERLPAESAGAFAGAVGWQVELPDPSAGEWTLQLNGPAGTGYHVLVTLDSGLQVILDGYPVGALAAGQPIDLRGAVASDTGHGPSNVTGMALTVTNVSAGYHALAQEAVGVAGDELSQPLWAASGVHGATVRLTGSTGEGYPFERTYSRSLLIASDDANVVD